MAYDILINVFRPPVSLINYVYLLFATKFIVSPKVTSTEYSTYCCL